VASVLQIVFGILQLKLAALIFDIKTFEHYLSLLLLTGMFMIIEQSAQTACINIFNRSMSAGLSEKNKFILLTTSLIAYCVLLVALIAYAFLKLSFVPISYTILIAFTFVCKSALILLSNIFAAQRKITLEKLLKLLGSSLMTAAFFISWLFDLDDDITLTILLIATLLGLIVAFQCFRKRATHGNDEQTSILREMFSIGQYLLPGSIYVMILPTAVSIFGTTGEKAALAILRQVILAGSSLVLSPTTSYLVLVTNTLKRVGDHAQIIEKLNRFFTIVVILVFCGAALTLLNFSRIYAFFVSSSYIDNNYFLIAIITFYYLELAQNVFSNLCVNLGEYATGLQICVVSSLAIFFFYVFQDNLAVSIALFATCTLLVISLKIMRLVKKHLTLSSFPLISYLCGVPVLTALSQAQFTNAAEISVIFILLILALATYRVLQSEYKYMEEKNGSIKGNLQSVEA